MYRQRATRLVIVGVLLAQLVFGVSVVPALSSRALPTPLALASHRSDADTSRSYSSSIRRKVSKLSRTPVKRLAIPVALGVEVAHLSDTWGDARSGGRTHEGIDIIAPRGAFVASPTKAVVTRVGKGELGGIYVYTANPGGETFYYAHLDRIADGVKPGKELAVGDLVGYVGNTGNASATVPHLHFTIYKRGAQNPYPRLTKTFTKEERVALLLEALADFRTQLASKK